MNDLYILCNFQMPTNLQSLYETSRLSFFFMKQNHEFTIQIMLLKLF